MANSTQHQRIADLLVEIGELVPEWRFTQIMVNAAETRDHVAPFFQMKDEELESRLIALKGSIEVMIRNRGQNDT